MKKFKFELELEKRRKALENSNLIKIIMRCDQKFLIDKNTILSLVAGQEVEVEKWIASSLIGRGFAYYHPDNLPSGLKKHPEFTNVCLYCLCLNDSSRGTCNHCGAPLGRVL